MTNGRYAQREHRQAYFITETKQELNPGEQIIELQPSRPINLDDVISLTSGGGGADSSATPRNNSAPHTTAAAAAAAAATAAAMSRIATRRCVDGYRFVARLSHAGRPKASVDGDDM